MSIDTYSSLARFKLFSSEFLEIELLFDLEPKMDQNSVWINPSIDFWNGSKFHKMIRVRNLEKIDFFWKIRNWPYFFQFSDPFRATIKPIFTKFSKIRFKIRGKKFESNLWGNIYE